MALKLEELAEAFKGEEGLFSYEEPQKKVYVLVVTGESAAHYKKLIETVKELSQAQSDRLMNKVAQNRGAK